MKLKKIWKKRIIKQKLILNKVEINPEKKKDIRKNTKNFVSNPGAKLGILNENVGNYNNAKHTKIPEKIRKKNSFSKQFVQVNYAYKKNK